MFQHISLTFYANISGKENSFISIVLEDNNREPPLFEWRILHIRKTGVVPSFGSCCS